MYKNKPEHICKRNIQKVLETQREEEKIKLMRAINDRMVKRSGQTTDADDRFVASFIGR